MFALHLAAGVSLAAVVDGIAGPALLLLAAGLGGTSAWRRALLRGPGGPQRLLLEAGGRGWLERRGRAVQPVRAHRVGRYWVSLETLAPIKASLLITRGMAPGGYRWLCLWALWGRVPPGPPPRTNSK